MEDDRSGIIPEITDLFKYENDLMMGSADRRDAYLSDRSLLSSGIIIYYK